MANAYVSYHQVALTGSAYGSSVLGRCVHSEVLAISASEAESAALTAAMGVAVVVASITTDDTACYIATGTAPDTTLEDKTAASSARIYLGAGLSLDIGLVVGERIAVKAIA